MGSCTTLMQGIPPAHHSLNFELCWHPIPCPRSPHRQTLERQIDQEVERLCRYARRWLISFRSSNGASMVKCFPGHETGCSLRDYIHVLAGIKYHRRQECSVVSRPRWTTSTAWLPVQIVTNSNNTLSSFQICSTCRQPALRCLVKAKQRVTCQQ